ncbi:hypothetical protein Esti_002465 [Eimeria stiedai]
MSYDRRSEPRRSLSGRRANYGGRRDGRSDGRSPDFRHQRGGDCYRRTYQNRTPEYGDRYRRRSPSDARHGRDARGHRYGRNAPYRRSRTPSPGRRRSRSLEQYHRSEKFSHRDAPSARFGSKASYLRSRGTCRGLSRSPSRSGRRQSPMLREQEERPDVGTRSESRGRYRGRRDDFTERSRRHPSNERQPSRSGRSTDRCESSYHRGRRTRQSFSPVRPEAIGRFAGRRGPERGERHREPSTGPREQKASQRRRSSSRSRGPTLSRSVSRPASGFRRGVATSTSRRLRETTGSPRWRSYSGRKGLRDASASVDQHSSTVRQRTHDEPRQHSDAISKRGSLDRCRRSRQPSSSGSRRREDAKSKRSRSSSHRKPHERPHSASKEQIEDVHNRCSDQQAQVPRRVLRSRSPECPTPDLALSRSLKTGSGQRHCVDAERKQQPESELSTPPVDGEIAQATGERDSFDGRDKHAPGMPEAQEHTFESHEATSPPTDQSKVRRSDSICRSPSMHRTEAGDDDQTKERGRSRSPTPVTKEHVPSAKDVTTPKDSSEPPTAGDASDEHGAASNTASDQHKDDGVKMDEDVLTAESKKAQSISLRSPGSRRRSSSAPQSPLRQDPDNAAADLIPESQADERSDSRQVSKSECVERTKSVERNVAKRRIVAAGPQHTPVGFGDIYRRAASPRRNFRTQRQSSTRGERFYSCVNRLQPVVRNRWSRLEVDGPFDYPQASYHTSASRSVRLVGAYTDRPPFFTPPPLNKNITPIDPRREPQYNKAFRRGGPPHVPQRARAFVRLPGAGSRKMAGFVKGGPERRHAAAATSNADGKWNHDLYEQLTSEPERKRPRFNLYGETLEKIED